MVIFSECVYKRWENRERKQRKEPLSSRNLLGSLMRDKEMELWLTTIFLFSMLYRLTILSVYVSVVGLNTRVVMITTLQKNHTIKGKSMEKVGGVWRDVRIN